MPCCPDPATPGEGALSPALFERILLQHAAFAVGDGEGRILHASPAFAELLGYRPEQLGGQGFRLLKSGLHDAAFYTALWRTVSSGAEWRGEIANRAQDGHVVWMDMRIGPVAGAAGRFYVMASDITARKRSEDSHTRLEGVLAQVIQADPVPTFVIDEQHVLTRWNRALEAVTGVRAEEVLGTRHSGRVFYGSDRPVMADLIVDGRIDALEQLYQGRCRRSAVIPDAYESEAFFPAFGEGGRWLAFTAAPLRDTDGRIVGAIETLQDVTERKRAEEAILRAQADLEVLVERRTEQLRQAKVALEQDVIERERSQAELRRRNEELTELNARLQETRAQLAQSERLASIGQLAAGVAHEINNPIGYVQSNIGALEGYLRDLFLLLESFEGALASVPADLPAVAAALALRQQKDLAFLREDVPVLMAETREGLARVGKIVADLKDFSRVDSSQEWQGADLLQGLESTLNIVNNEIKYKAEVVREYGELPEVECLPSQLNQVFMNLLVNAAHAIDGETRGRITLRTGFDAPHQQVWVEIADSGCGIPQENLQRIFDPFFTTKPVGKGTGLGLSLSYGIIQKHHGRIEVDSRPGAGTTFRITLPVRQSPEEGASP